MSRKRNMDSCPICVRWVCYVYGCGWNSRQVWDGRKPLRDRKCNVCGSDNGEYLPVTHYKRDLHEEHVLQARQEERVFPVSKERINDVVALLELIKPHAAVYQDMVRRNLRTATGSFENNAVINRGNEALLKIDNTIREWLLNHPDESYS